MLNEVKPNDKSCIRFIADSYRVALNMSALTLTWSTVLYFDFCIISGLYKGDSVIGGVLIITVPLLVVTWALFFLEPSWTDIITLSPEEIRVKRFAKKPMFYAYSDFPCMTRASYCHRMAGTNCGPQIQYIVLSKRRLTDFERYNVNQLVSSEKMLKIKCTKRNVERLLQVLPAKQSRQLALMFPQDQK